MHIFPTLPFDNPFINLLSYFNLFTLNHFYLLFAEVMYIYFPILHRKQEKLFFFYYSYVVTTLWQQIQVLIHYHCKTHAQVVMV